MPIHFEVKESQLMGEEGSGKLILISSEAREAKEIQLQFIGFVAGVLPKFNFHLHEQTVISSQNQFVSFRLEIPFTWKIPFDRPSSFTEWPKIVWGLTAKVEWANGNSSIEYESFALNLQYDEKIPPNINEIKIRLKEERRKATEWDQWDRKDLDRTFAFVGVLLFLIFGSHFVCRPEGAGLGFGAVGIGVTSIISLFVGLFFVKIRSFKKIFENLILSINRISIPKNEIFALPGSSFPWRIPRFSSWSLRYNRRVIEFEEGTHRGDSKIIENRWDVFVEIQSGKTGLEEEEVLLSFGSELPPQIFVPHRHLYYTLCLVWEANWFRGVFWKIKREIPIVFGYWKDHSP